MKVTIQDLDSSVLNLWAKKRTTDGKQLWLPLVVHLLDTEQVINWLLNHWMSRGQVEVLAQQFGEDELRKLVKFIGFTHDSGKATPAFETKKSYDGGASLDRELLEKLVRSGFVGIDTLELMSPNMSQHTVAGEALLDSFGVPDSVAAIIGGHHGRPLDQKPDSQIRGYTANYWQEDTEAPIWKLWQNAQRQLFEFGLHLAGYEDVSEIPSVTQPQAVLLEGLLIMSDWLSSSEYLEATGEPLFPLITLDQDAQSIDIKERFQNAMITWQRQVGEWEPRKVDWQEDPYRERWGFNARPVQRVISQAIEHATNPGMIVVEAPMGIGKTEVALLAAEQLANKTQRNGLYFGLPTQATSNAMFSRVNEWLNYIRTTQNNSLSIELMHGKRQFNQEFQQLPRATQIDTDGEDVNSVVVNEWFSGKKTILDEFTVGTIDNLLRMALKQKHLALRHLGLSKKVVVIDEAHAYSVYMDGYLYRALEWLGAYGVPVVVLSATLPKEKRNDLLAAYFHGKYGRELAKSAVTQPGWQNQEAYPLVTMLDGKLLRQITEFGEQSTQSIKQVTVRRLNVPNADLLADVVEALSEGGVAGIIVNTVKRAQELARLVPNDMPFVVLHSAFLATDRAKLEQEIQNVIGKNGKRPDRMIVIGTQVLEQSLDIDFDILYTDIAPMDLLLQRAGRMHRHEISRPDKLKTPTLVVMGIERFGDYGKENEGIYAKYLLMKTDLYLDSVIHLPTDISHLVQVVYDESTALDVSAVCSAKKAFMSELAIKKAESAQFQINPPKRGRRATLHGWLNKRQASVERGEQQANAAVRDIRETLEVILLQRTEEGVALIDGRLLQNCPDQVVAQQLVRLPTVVSLPITDTIDKLEKETARCFPDWQDKIWLRGEIAIVLNEQQSYVLNDWRLQYSSRYGLSYSKEEENGQ